MSCRTMSGTPSQTASRLSCDSSPPCVQAWLLLLALVWRVIAMVQVYMDLQLISRP